MEGFVLLIMVLGVILIYLLYFKEYKEVMANFETLIKVLETRDLLLMRILPEIKDKNIKEETVKLVEQRMQCKNGGCNALIKSDVELNKQLNITYRELEKIKNALVREEFKRIVSLEKKLKVIRREYNEAVEKYNQNLINHKKMCIKYLRMKPLDTYKIPEKVKN